MELPEHSGPRSTRGKLPSSGGFSLVEVTIALGLAAFAFLAIFGLLPAGLETFHKSMDASVSAQIMQRTLNEVRQTDFDKLTNQEVTEPGLSQTPFIQTPSPRYFDDEGTELPTSSGAIYQMQTRIAPVTIVPQGASAEPQITNPNLVTVTIQIASNPGNLTLASDVNSELWNDSRVSISTYSTLVARNR